MKLRVTELLQDAMASWKADRDLLLRIGGVFFLLPIFALNLFLPDLVTEGMDPEASRVAMTAWIGTSWYWFAAQLVVQLLGSMTILAMLLAPSRPTLGEAILRALRLLPVAVATMLIAMLLFLLFAFPFMLIAYSLVDPAVLSAVLIVPMLYMVGRTFPVIAIVAVEALNPLAALRKGWRWTRRQGWTLASTYLMIAFANLFVAALIQGIGAAVIPVLPLAAALFHLLIAMVGAVAAIASALLQVAVYRALSESSTGM